MAKKTKEVKPFPIAVAILLLLLAFAVMGLFLFYMFSPSLNENSHVDSLGEQSFEEESSVEPPPPPVVEVKEFMSEANVGDVVVYGKYEQDNNSENGAEPIEWSVLDKNDEGLFLISRFCLDCKPYNEKREDVNWVDSTLRSWLNGDFYNTAFDETERANIIPKGEGVLVDPVDSSAETQVEFQDKVSILSSEDAKKYYEYDSWRITSATDYAVNNGAYVSGESAWWWLRESGIALWSKDSEAQYVYFNGAIKDLGFAVDYDIVAVRPVIWVSLNAEKGDSDNTQPDSSEISQSQSEVKSEITE
ncbi:MAG: hypothetical protein E7586_03740 [Ruminococcaceae bacterium]|nr:hypothetical protein [Oscillospiraceae bacterium]